MIRVVGGGDLHSSNDKGQNWTLGLGSGVFFSFFFFVLSYLPFLAIIIIILLRRRVRERTSWREGPGLKRTKTAQTNQTKPNINQASARVSSIITVSSRVPPSFWQGEEGPWEEVSRGPSVDGEFVAMSWSTKLAFLCIRYSRQSLEDNTRGYPLEPESFACVI